MGDDRGRGELFVPDQLGEIDRVGGQRIVAVRRPVAVAMAAQVQREDAIVVAQVAGDEIPAVGVIIAAMDQDDRRGVTTRPFEIMQP